MNSKWDIGSKNPLFVRREQIETKSGTSSFRIFYASDLHFFRNSSENVVQQLVDVIRQSNPNVILLGGDLVDGRSGCALLSAFVSEASRMAPLWAVKGNHDARVPSSYLEHSLTSAGGHWLGEKSLRIHWQNRRVFKIDGRVRSFSPLLTSSDFPILCTHNPVVFPQAAKLYYSLVLAGHLHGGQIVLWEKESKLYPGAWFYKWNGLKFRINGTTMIVSRGVSDTLPVRWNCPREVILCEIS